MTFPVRITDAPLWKTPPAPVVKAEKAKDEEKERKRIKKLVFARDKSRCRVCGGKAGEMHELKFRSLGGKRSLVNSIAVCNFTGPHNCHRLLQCLAVDVQGEDANKTLVFSWNRHQIAKSKEPFKLKEFAA